MMRHDSFPHASLVITHIIFKGRLERGRDLIAKDHAVSCLLKVGEAASNPSTTDPAAVWCLRGMCRLALSRSADMLVHLTAGVGFCELRHPCDMA